MRDHTGGIARRFPGNEGAKALHFGQILAGIQMTSKNSGGDGENFQGM